MIETSLRILRESRDSLEAELTKLLDPHDRCRVTLEAFEGFEQVDEFMADPTTLRYMLVVRFWRYIDGQKYMSCRVVTPGFISDSLVRPTIFRHLIDGWTRLRDEAIRSGPPEA